MDISAVFYVLGGIVVAVLGILAIRVVASFDVNKWLERKDNKMVVRLQNACPHTHVEFVEADGGMQFLVKSFFESPVGTLDWVCAQCKQVLHSQSFVPNLPTNEAEVKAVMEQQKIYLKLGKKAGYT